MPYMFIEDDAWDAESMGDPADVVPRADYATLEADRDELRTQRDAAAERIGTLEQELKDSRDRYARHVITQGDIVHRTKKDVRENSTAQSFAQLFSNRTQG